MAQKQRFAIPVDGELVRLLEQQNRLLTRLLGVAALAPTLILDQTQKELQVLPESFSARLQRFKLGEGFSVGYDDTFNNTSAANQFSKLLLKNPEGSPSIIVVTETRFFSSAASRWYVEEPVEPASTSTGANVTPRSFTTKRQSVANIQSILSDTEPTLPALKAGRLAAGGFETLPLGSVLPPNTSQLFELFQPATTDLYSMGIEFFEIPIK